MIRLVFASSYIIIGTLFLGAQFPASVGCFGCQNGSPQLTLALSQTEWSHSRLVPRCAGDENGCPLRNSRNFHLALPASVGGCMGPKLVAYEMLSLHNLFWMSSAGVKMWDVVYLKHQNVYGRGCGPQVKNIFSEFSLISGFRPFFYLNLWVFGSVLALNLEFWLLQSVAASFFKKCHVVLHQQQHRNMQETWLVSPLLQDFFHLASKAVYQT